MSLHGWGVISGRSSDMFRSKSAASECCDHSRIRCSQDSAWRPRNRVKTSYANRYLHQFAARHLTAADGFVPGTDSPASHAVRWLSYVWVLTCNTELRGNVQWV